MRIAVHNLNRCERSNTTLRLFGENGSLQLSIRPGNVLSVRYDHDLSNPGYDRSFERIAAWSSAQTDWNGAPGGSVGRPTTTGWESINEQPACFEAISGGLRVVVDRATAVVSVELDGKRLFGGKVGDSDTVIPSFPVRVRRVGRRLVGKMNFRLEDDDHFYGLGDKSGSLDKSGRRFKMFNRDALGYDGRYSDPLYKSIPFMLQANTRRDSYCGILFPAPGVREIDLGVESKFYFSAEIDGGPFEYVLFPGRNYHEVLASYTAYCGRPALPPLFTFGFLGSSMAYAEGDDAEGAIEEYLQKIEHYGIPCEGFYLSSGYTKTAEGKRYTFVWNRDKFPDPTAFVSKLLERGYRICCNLKPGILAGHPWYGELSEKGHFIAGDDGKDYLEYYWGSYASFPDLLRQEVYDWWKDLVRREFLDRGVRGIWNDNNECEIEDDTLEVSVTKSAYPVRMSQASFEASLEASPDVRPWIISRAGSVGIQRYARTWTGDNTSNFVSFDSNILMGLSLGLSGVPFYGHDVGGFYGDPPTPELLLRWCQASVFHPRFVLHSWNADGLPTEAWMYPELTEQIVELIRAHYSFMPYIYSTAVEASRSGIPMERALELEFPDDRENLVDSRHYLFGPWVLALNATSPGTSEVRIRPPRSTRWVDPETSLLYPQGVELSIEYPMAGVHYLVREGAILPTTSRVAPLQTGFFEEVEFRLFPSSEEGTTSYQYVEDDGEHLPEHAAMAEYTLRLGSAPHGTMAIEPLASRTPPNAVRRFVFTLPEGFRFTEIPAGDGIEERGARSFGVRFTGHCPGISASFEGRYSGEIS